MTLPQAIASCVRQAALFNGRAPRSEYWLWHVFCVCLTLLCLFLGLPAEGMSLLSFALFVPSIAVCCRRLHDINLRGWWQLLPVILLNSSLYTLSKNLTAAPDPTGEQAQLLPFIGLATGFLLWLYWGSKPGTARDNRFGPNPLGETFFFNDTGESFTALTLIPTDSEKAAHRRLTNLLSEELLAGDAVLVDVYPLTLNRKKWTVLAQSDTGSVFSWKDLPVRTGRTYILSPDGVEDVPSQDLEQEWEKTGV